VNIEYAGGGSIHFSRNLRNACENVRSEILAGGIYGSDGRICKLDVKSRMCERSIEDGII
jgi:hypothetical protein